MAMVGQPGESSIAPPPGFFEPIGKADTCLAQVKQTERDLIGVIRDTVNAQLGQVAATESDLAYGVQSEIYNRLINAQKSLDTIETGLLGSFYGCLGGAAEVGSGLGIPMPTADELGRLPPTTTLPPSPPGVPPPPPVPPSPRPPIDCPPGSLCGPAMPPPQPLPVPPVPAPPGPSTPPPGPGPEPPLPPAPPLPGPLPPLPGGDGRVPPLPQPPGICGSPPPGMDCPDGTRPMAFYDPASNSCLWRCEPFAPPPKPPKPPPPPEPGKQCPPCATDDWALVKEYDLYPPEKIIHPKYWVWIDPSTDCPIHVECYTGSPYRAPDIPGKPVQGPYDYCPDPANWDWTNWQASRCGNQIPPPPTPVPPGSPEPKPPPNEDGTTPPPEPKPLPISKVAIDWCDTKLCQYVERWKRGDPGDLDTYMPDLKEFDILTDQSKQSALKERLEAASPSGTAWFTRLAWSILVAPFFALVNFLLSLVPCETSWMRRLTLRIWGLSFVQKWTGIDLGSQLYRAKSLASVVCPSQLPSLAQAHSARLSDTISYATWDCWVAANDFCPQYQEAVYRSGRVKPNHNEAIALYRRGEIDEETLGKVIREAGVIEDEDVRRLYALTTFVPPPTDFIRFMVRDVFDETIVQKFEYDQDFSKKYSGQAQDWGFANGLDDETAKYYWRAHWRLPSPTQAYEMLHRLRPEKEEVKYPVIRNDVRTLLQVDDVAPYWQERMIDISYAVPRLVDTRNAYFRGVYTHDKLVSVLQDRGYDLATAKDVGELMKKEKLAWASGRKWAILYRQCLISLAKAQELADQDGVDYDTFREVTYLMGVYRESDLIAQCSRGIRSQFLMGGLLFEDAVNQLSLSGMEQGCAVTTVQAWLCTLKAKSKLPRVAQMCQWVQMGIMTPAEMTTRLVRIGYAVADAQRYVAACLLSIKRKEEQDQKAKDKAQKREQEAEKRARDKEAKKQQQGQKRERGNADKARKAAEARRLKLEKAAVLVARLCGATIEEAQDQLLLRIGRVNLNYHYSLDGSYDLVTELAKEAIVDYPDDCLDELDRRIFALPELPWDDVELTGPDLPEPVPPAGVLQGS